MPQWNLIAEKIKSRTGQALITTSAQRIMGGDINESYCLISKDGTRFFIKINAKNLISMFADEAAGLAAIASSESIRVPEVILYDQTETESYLVLEYLEFCSTRDQKLLGRQLAAMHRCTQPKFGWHRNNTIGSMAQINSLNTDWCHFWVENRLSVQLDFAKQNGCDHILLGLGERLIQKSPLLFASYLPKASLLHGDLWSGNVSSLMNGDPVIFDPAVYYGDREADLAMMELFGGFDENCFAAYQEISPIDTVGYALRKKYYNLYHLLNHLNIFGSSYQHQCVDTLQQLLAEV